MERVVILYHSGTGSTKVIAEVIYMQIRAKMETVLVSIEDMRDTALINSYDYLIIGFPTYHSAPSASIQTWLNALKPFERRKKAFIFTTCGLYSANTLRIFAKQCRSKNIEVIQSRVYRAPASDGVLIAPWMKRWYTFEKDIVSKLKKDLEAVVSLFKDSANKQSLPRFKLYSVINYPNKLAGSYFSSPIYLFPDQCIRCQRCIKKCPHRCFTMDSDSLPQYRKDNCEHCYRCIHACPNKALSIHKRCRPSNQLDARYFEEAFLKISSNIKGE